ncbi:SMP-30/gluconolactonase/LRE family protein [Sphingomonas sp. DBB INV C78]|uniref:SMP-30/gluconolactonase/LRE family protein n=1 Tax=Sphingomonas sp. DBB INV C78 TaxID=3349434 RepID=UPI0036D3BA43
MASGSRAPWPDSPAEAADPAHFPESAMVLRGAIGDAIEKGDKQAVAKGAATLAAMGSGLRPESRARIAPFLDPEQRDALSRQFDDNVDAVTLSVLEAEIPAEHRIVEGVAWDAKTQRLFASTVIDGRLLVREGKTWRTVPLQGPVGGLFGMAVDAPRRLLWLTSGLAEQVAKPEKAFRGLIAVDLDRLTVVRRVPIATGSPGDLAVAADGSVYVSNGETGAIHVCAPGCDKVQDLLPPGRFRSPQGLAFSRDGKLLYIADYGYGIAVYDLRRKALSRLAAAKPAMLDGVDGLVRHKSDLIAIQNGTNPRRIIRLRLGSDGLTVRAIEILGRSNPDWPEPTLGVIAGDNLLFVADGQWERFGLKGVPIGNAPPKPTPIRALRLPN